MNTDYNYYTGQTGTGPYNPGVQVGNFFQGPPQPPAQTPGPFQAPPQQQQLPFQPVPPQQQYYAPPAPPAPAGPVRLCEDCVVRGVNTGMTAKVSGPQAKNPGKVYYHCATCPDQQSFKGWYDDWGTANWTQKRDQRANYAKRKAPEAPQQPQYQQPGVDSTLNGRVAALEAAMVNTQGGLANVQGGLSHTQGGLAAVERGNAQLFQLYQELKALLMEPLPPTVAPVAPPTVPVAAPAPAPGQSVGSGPFVHASDLARQQRQ